MKKKLLTGLAIGIGLVTAIAGKPSPHIGPDYLYPNPQYTPGLVATSDLKELTSKTACGTYSQCHRKTTQAMKNTVCKEYPTNCTGTQEIDHFCPLALGCADDVKNLWAQPAVNMWNGEDYGFHAKDKLENLLVIEVKGGQITPKDAQDCILHDWVACYLKYVKQVYGSVIPNVNDPDDNN